MTKRGMTIADLQVRVADQVVELMERDGIHWTKCWATPRPPCNAVSGHVYRGMNTITTALDLMIRETDDPRYVSRSNAFGLGKQAKVGKLRKGEKGIPIFVNATTKRTDDTTGEEYYGSFFRIHWVWHISQFDEVDERLVLPVSDFIPPDTPAQRIAQAEAYVAATSAVIETAAAAFYDPTADKIGMPAIETFLDGNGTTAAENYYATLMHELTHWTGAAHRIDRLTEKRGAEYAYEELIAELGSVMLCMSLGIQSAPRESNAAYLKVWKSRLKSHPGTITSAASAAAKAVNFLDAFQPDRAQQEAT